MKQFLYPLLLILSLQFSFESIAQPCFDEIAATEIPENPTKMREDDPAYVEFLENTNCFHGEELDSVALRITTNGPYLVLILMLESMESDDPITYRRLKELMIDFTKKEDYPEIRELFLKYE